MIIRISELYLQIIYMGKLSSYEWLCWRATFANKIYPLTHFQILFSSISDRRNIYLVEENYKKRKYL